MSNLVDSIRSIPDFPSPGIIFRDITPLLENPVQFQEVIDLLAEKVQSFGSFDKIAAPEARGFIFAAPLALRLNAGFIPIRKKGKLPYKTVSASYELEYGTDVLYMHADAVKPGEKVLLLDDLLATGGTIVACRSLVEQLGGSVVGYCFVSELTGLNGRAKIVDPNVVALLDF